MIENSKSNDSVKRCSKCVLPSNFPNIIFNSENICNYCTSYEPQKPLGEQAFQQIIDEAKSKASKYDCMVPVSGGRDSTYVLHQIKNVHGLNVLAYNYDNGFTSLVATENVKKITDRLGVELIQVKSKQDIQARNLRHIIKLNLRKSPEFVATTFCSGCQNGIWGGAYMVAKKYQIPLVVFGESTMEFGIAKQIMSKRLRRTKKDKIKEALKMPMNFMLRKYHQILFRQEFPLSEYPDIKKVNYFDYFKWDENQMLEVLFKKLNWNIESDMSSWRFDCKIHAVVNYSWKHLFGFTEKEELYSNMIRENQMTREKALEKLAANPESDKKELEIVQEVLQKLRLTENERRTILNYGE
jgi:glutamine---fructose-6-phosphate transaminase (isomerizing)